MSVGPTHSPGFTWSGTSSGSPAVANATAYNILRNDASCAAGSTIIATVPGTTFTDSGLANGFAEYYTVQAVGASASCDGLLSNCQAVTPQQLLEGYHRVLKEVYSIPSIFKRLRGTTAWKSFFYPMNFGFWRSIRNLPMNGEK